jgi:predicted TIM-barrel fold metal-dependent hydrolase
MDFFDCNVFIGLPDQRSVAPVKTVPKLLSAMDRVGVTQALVWHIAQHDATPHVGNQLLMQAIDAQPRLWGCWAMLPNQAREFSPPYQLFREMREARVKAIRVFPNDHKFLINGVTMGPLLDAMVSERIPLFISVKRGMTWRDLYALLNEFPELICVICDHGCWGEDRRFRPLLERYPYVYVDTSQYLLDGGIEALVADYGARRILFGSGFPESYFGGMMMALKHAEIPSVAKAAIAHDNLSQILAEVRI